MDITSILVYLKGLIGTILSLLMMLSPISSAGESFGAKDSEKLVTSFAVVSDIHVETNNPEPYGRFKGVLEGIKAGEDIKTAVYLGDNVMNGQDLENFFFYTAVKAVSPAENNLVVMGNHDIGNGEGVYTHLRDSFLGFNHTLTGERYENPYYYKVIDGCYFIVLGIEDLTVNESVMTQAQLDWLKGVLDEAQAADANIFVLNHHPMNYLNGVPSDSLENLLKQYDKVMFFHGHMHKAMDETSYYTMSGIPCFNVPRATDIGDGYIVEVYEDEILVRGRNFIEGSWYEALEYSFSF